MIKISEEEFDLLSLPARVSAIEVAKMIRLPSKANILNKIDLDLTPYIKLFIELIGKTHVEWLFQIAPTQSGKTVSLQIVMADAISQDPGTIIYINPDEALTKKNMQEKVINMILETPELLEHSVGSKKMAKTQVELDNMTIFGGWAGSLSTMSSIAAKRVILDEIRLMKLQIGDESNALKLAGDRLTTYLHMGLGQGYAVSTPSVEGDLLHQQLSVPNTDVLLWHVRCSNCGAGQVLDFFKNKKIDKMGEYHCACSSCGHYFDDSDQKRITNASGYYATESGLLVPVPKLKKRVVTWYTSMDSPFRPFGKIWEEYRQTKNKLHDYKNFWQCWLARFWIDDMSKTSVEELEKRRIGEPVGIVPEWTKLITAGIDSQKSGFYVVIRAWGENRRTRVIDAYFVECRLPLSDASDVKLVLRRDVIDRIFSTAKGEKWKVGLTCIDTGGNRTKQIYKGTAKFERFIWIKGVGDKQSTTIRKSKDLDLYHVRTVEYLDETEEKSILDSFELPPNISKDYMRQFVNVRKVKDHVKKTGADIIIWKKIGQFDYRMADVHAFICLDIPTSLGTFRQQLENENFYYNPIIKKIEADAIEANEVFEDDDDESDYEIGNFTDGGI